MKIAFTAQGTTWDSMIDPRFGRTAWLLFYDEENDTLSDVDNRSADQEAHGAGPKTAGVLVEQSPDILITGNGPGDNAARALAQTGIRIFTGAGDMTIKEAYKSYKSNKLTELN